MDRARLIAVTAQASERCIIGDGNGEGCRFEHRVVLQVESYEPRMLHLSPSGEPLCFTNQEDREQWEFATESSSGIPRESEVDALEIR